MYAWLAIVTQRSLCRMSVFNLPYTTTTTLLLREKKICGNWGKNEHFCHFLFNLLIYS
jgi:hypothetical protein